MRAAPLAVLISFSLSGQSLPRILQFPPEIWPTPQPRVNVRPRHHPLYYEVDIDNANTRVLRVKLKADATYATASAGWYLHPGVLVALTETQVFVEAPPVVGNAGHEIKLQPGQSQWVPDDTILLRNLSTTPAEFLFIEMKQAPASR